MSAEDVLVVAEIQRETLSDVTLELLAAARGLTAATGGQVVALVLTADGARYAPALAAADRIVLVDDPLLAAYSPEPFVAALQEVVAAEQPRAVLIGATSIGWDLAPLLAAPTGRAPGDRRQGDPARQRRPAGYGFLLRRQDAGRSPS